MASAHHHVHFRFLEIIQFQLLGVISRGSLHLAIKHLIKNGWLEIELHVSNPRHSIRIVTLGFFREAHLYFEALLGKFLECLRVVLLLCTFSGNEIVFAFSLLAIARLDRSLCMAN
jgi:hypothetical protein